MIASFQVFSVVLQAFELNIKSVVFFFNMLLGVGSFIITITTTNIY